MRAEQFQRRVRWHNALEYVAAAFVVAAFGKMMFDASTPMMRIGSFLLVAGTLYVVTQLYRRASSRRVPPHALADACVAFHRHELERRRDALASVWSWYLAPLVPGIIVFLLSFPLEARTGWREVAIVFGASALFFIAVGVANRNAAKRLQREIDALAQND